MYKNFKKIGIIQHISKLITFVNLWVSKLHNSLHNIHKKSKQWNLDYSFLCEKPTFSAKHILIDIFWRTLVKSFVCVCVCVCVCVFVCVCLFCRLCCILKLKTAEGWFFKRVRLCMWAIGRQQLGTLSIPVHNSLIVHHSSWALKFDNFSEFQNVISDSPPPHTHTQPSVIMTLCVRKSIFASPLSSIDLFGDI